MTEPVNPFFDKPILNSPYGYPDRHWELDEQALFATKPGPDVRNPAAA